ncbi:SRPBCC family protein [Kocuria sp. LUK]|uniref:Polyketide cyclase n=1 Tax=Kocuria flava TaxID=446860 RepID=A0A2N4T003_9MICC|nr:MULTISPECIES: SRPBCC family protein [Kocuria]MCD1144342.1 SRPBCC family protein [Kocuria sp. LUK]PLC11568.1 hypothetical protein AUQ48_04050 [Kocuria flava]
MARRSTTFRLSHSTLVAAEPSLVERFVLDPGCFAAWRRGVRGEVQTSTPVLQLGTSIEFLGGFGPLRFPYVTIVSDHVPGELLALRTTRGLVDLDVVTRWRAVDGGTLVEAHLDGRCTAAKARLLPFVRAAIDRDNQLDLATLKRLLETGDFRFTVPSHLTPHPPRCTLENPPDFV